jgi:hypothetical protein
MNASTDTACRRPLEEERELRLDQIWNTVRFLVELDWLAAADGAPGYTLDGVYHRAQDLALDVGLAAYRGQKRELWPDWGDLGLTVTLQLAALCVRLLVGPCWPPTVAAETHDGLADYYWHHEQPWPRQLSTGCG